MENRPSLLRRAVEVLGGRYSTEAGIDVDRGPAQVERWFLLATLFGTRISAATAVQTYGVLRRAGVRTIRDAGRRSWDDLVALLDEGGYARYDLRTATRLLDLARVVEERHGGRVSKLANIADPRELETALDELPGWGPTTVRVFLRELRGLWPGADPPVDERVRWAAAHLGSALPRDRNAIGRLLEWADANRLDHRDLEAALVRVALAHRSRSTCPGGERCRVLVESSTDRTLTHRRRG